MSISLDNVVRVSVSGPSRGLSSVNTSALCIMTHEEPIHKNNYGDSKVYLNPIGVAEDFGTNSETFKLANAIFSQTSNMLKGGGYLVVIPRKPDAGAAPAVLLSSGNVDLTSLSAEDYVIRVWVNGSGDQDLTIGKIDRSTIEKVEASLNNAAVKTAGIVFSVTGEMTSASIKATTISTGINSRVDIDIAQIEGSDLASALKIIGEGKGADAGLERIKDCILRTVGQIPYFGVCYTEKMSDVILKETAATVQSLNIFQVVASDSLEDVNGVFKEIKDSGFTKTRCLYYSSAAHSLLFAAGYLSILMSIDFNAGGSALTMNLKDFVGLIADDSINDDIIGQAKKAGVDVLANIGIPKIFSHGANQYADQMYTRLALQVDLQIAGINFLSKTNTKIPQTPEGMTGLKSAYRRVLERYVRAGVYSPGAWVDSTTFGPNPDDHRRNIKDRGYFIYSLPLSKQPLEQREARIAPVIQIAVKESGALHSSNVVVLVEA